MKENKIFGYDLQAIEIPGHSKYISRKLHDFLLVLLFSQGYIENFVNYKRIIDSRKFRPNLPP